MSRIRERIDRCDALDILEEAALIHRRLTLVLEDGERVTGQVVGVITEAGADRTRLADGTEVRVDRIVWIEPAY